VCRVFVEFAVGILENGRTFIGNTHFCDFIDFTKPLQLIGVPHWLFLCWESDVLEMLDMHFVVLDILCQHVGKIAKVTMGASPKQG
jgi:hypothetical protein